MKKNEAAKEIAQASEFMEAFYELHDANRSSVDMVAIRERIVAMRLSEMAAGSGFLYRVGTRLRLIDITEETEATRQRLEDNGLVVSVPEADTLAVMYNQLPVRLVSLP